MATITPSTTRTVSGETRRGDASFSISERYAQALGSLQNWPVMSGSGTRSGVTGEAEMWPGATELVQRTDVPGLLTVESDSAADGPTGIGAAAVVVEYIDANGWERFGVAVLPGVISTPVPVTQFTRVSENLADPPVPLPGNPQAVGTRINRVYVSQLGSAGTEYTAGNEGTILALIDGTAQAGIYPNSNLSSASAFTIPRGRIGLLDALSVAADVAVGSRNRIYVKNRGAPRVSFATLNVGTQPLPTTLPIPVQLQPLADIIFTIERSGGGQVEASSTFQIGIPEDLRDRDREVLLQPPRLT